MKMKFLKLKLPNWWPWVTRKTYFDMVRAMSEAQARLCSKHNRDLEEAVNREKLALKEWVAKMSQIVWEHQDAGFYRVSVNMDPRATAIDDAKSREIIAFHVSRDIENQIISCRFVQMSREERRRLLKSVEHPFPI